MPLDVIGNGSFSDSLNVTNTFLVGASSLLVNNAGNVGIGTTAPTHTLNVVGNVNITGDLFVQGQNMTVPDYVFEKYFGREIKDIRAQGYEMMDLAELGQYLHRESKLPPSIVQGSFSTDVKSNNIVQQQYYLLEKVEEQAIYIIQLKEEKDKELQELKARIQALEAQAQQNDKN